MSSMEKILLIIIIICIFILFTKVDSNIPEHFILPKRTKDYFLYEGQSLMDISFNTLNQVDNNYNWDDDGVLHHHLISTRQHIPITIIDNKLTKHDSEYLPEFGFITDINNINMNKINYNPITAEKQFYNKIYQYNNF